MEPRLMRDGYDGLFVAEGTSDAPLAGIVQGLFAAHDVSLVLTGLDPELLEDTRRDVRSKVAAGLTLRNEIRTDLIVVHRDADNAGVRARRDEVLNAVSGIPGHDAAVIPVIPVRMTEAWLLLDEGAIRRAAGRPTGKVSLNLPKAREAEQRADPKRLLRDCLLTAAEATGRRRGDAAGRFNEQRRALLEDLDINGPVGRLASWQALVADVARVAKTWR